MFYDVYCALCEKNGLTPSGAATKIGFNRASVTVWKNTGKAPKQELLLKIADYFGVTTDYLLTGKEKAPTPWSERPKSKLRSIARLEDSKITPEQDEQIADFIDYLLSKKKDQ